jgi:hypothetical protein
MKEQITALLEQRAAHIQRMRDLVVAAETEERDLTAEEAQEYDKIEKDADNLEERARRMEKLAGLAPQPERQIRDTNDGDGGQADAPDWMDDELRSGWNGKVPTDWAGFQELRRGTRPEDEPDYATVFFRWLTIPDVRNMTPGEFRVLSKASAGAGLNTVPTSFQRELIVALRDYGVMRQIARVITTDSGEDLQWPTVTAHGTASWTAENAAFSASDETFGHGDAEGVQGRHADEGVRGAVAGLGVRPSRVHPRRVRPPHRRPREHRRTSPATAPESRPVSPHRRPPASPQPGPRRSPRTSSSTCTTACFRRTAATQAGC